MFNKKKYTPEEQAYHRKLWSEALKSGAYRQGRGALKVNDGKAFCCLGVACDISGIGKWNGQSYDCSTIIHTDASSGYLPSAVAHWLGIASDEGKMKSRVKSRSTLAMMNDSCEHLFEEIADQIDRDNLILEGEEG